LVTTETDDSHNTACNYADGLAQEQKAFVKVVDYLKDRECVSPTDDVGQSAGCLKVLPAYEVFRMLTVLLEPEITGSEFEFRIWKFTFVLNVQSTGVSYESFIFGPS
jgi:hypothetical protein